MSDDSEMTLSQPPTQTQARPPTPGFGTPAQPLLQREQRRPKKLPNPRPMQISEKFAQFDDALVEAFDTFGDLVNTGLTLSKNATEDKVFYDRLQELKDDFDQLIILRHGGRKKKSLALSRTRRHRRSRT